MKKLSLLILLFCTFNEQHACARRVKNKVQEVVDNCRQVEYQRAILKSITASTAALGVKRFHMLVPQSMSLNSPFLATILTQFLDMLPGFATQGALLKRTIGKKVTLHNISRAVELGIYTALVLFWEERLILLVLPPDSLITSATFLCMSAATAPTFTTWILSYVDDLTTKLKTFFGCGRRNASSSANEIVIIDVLPITYKEKED